MTQNQDAFPTKCYYQDADSIDLQLLERLHIHPGELYASVGNIVALAKAIQARQGAPLISLPFDHTVEAKALGAEIRPADESAGPRPGQYTLQNPGQLELVNLVNEPEIACLLEACFLLQTDGYRVAYQLSGPVSILSCLMNLSVVFKVWRKQPELMGKIFANLEQMLLAYVDAVGRSGAAYLSYADPAGNADILGPKFSRLLTEQFTAPFLIKAQQLVSAGGYHTTLLLCPLTAGALSREGRLACISGQKGLAVGCLKAGPGQMQEGFDLVG